MYMKEKQNPNLLHVYVHDFFYVSSQSRENLTIKINTMNLLDVLMAIVKY